MTPVPEQVCCQLGVGYVHPDDMEALERTLRIPCVVQVECADPVPGMVDKDVLAIWQFGGGPVRVRCCTSTDHDASDLDGTVFGDPRGGRRLGLNFDLHAG